MNIISLVPSITETLIDCGVSVVGRTRFCIHPTESVNKIPKVGGTKDINWSKAQSCAPDLVILDKEENTIEMAQSCPFPYFVLHITSIHDVSAELNRLAEHINNDKLKKVANEWKQVTDFPPRSIQPVDTPGILGWWQKPDKQKQLVYLIWKKPWMAIGENTFIQSMLDACGLKKCRISFADKYPQISLDKLNKKDTVLLFSSEPYPFGNEADSLKQLGFACGLVDGELFSWYGTRSLKFLQRIKNKGT